MMNQNLSKTKRNTVTALFAAIAAVLMYFEFPLPFMPPFLKLDLSGVATLIVAFMMGPAPAVAVTLIKNIVHLMSSNTGGVGQIADFIILSGFAVTAALIYLRGKDRKHAILGCLAGTVVACGVGVIANKFILIPFYSQIMPVEAIVSACSNINPLINSMNAYYIYGVIPFNFIKGMILSLITILLYKKLSILIKK